MQSTRRLTGAETTLADEIFQGSVDFSPVWLTRDWPVTLIAPVALGNSIHLKSAWGHFQGDTLDLTAAGLQTLIHELVHVWQYQNGGLAYIPRSLAAQLVAVLRTGDRGGAYRWREPLLAGVPWARWNPEQQAQAVEEYARAWLRHRAGRATPFEHRILDQLAPCVEQLRQRQGAPRTWT